MKRELEKKEKEKEEAINELKKERREKNKEKATNIGLRKKVGVSKREIDFRVCICMHLVFNEKS